MLIVLIPFTTLLMSTYHHLQITNVLFELNVFIIGLLLFLSWTYATHDYHLVDETVSPKQISMGKLRSLLTSVVSVVAIIIPFFSPDWSTIVYVSIP